MKRLIFALGILFLFACSKSSPTSSSGSGNITMKTPSGANFSSSNISTQGNNTNGSFNFTWDVNSTYRKFYAFIGKFDAHNDLFLDITLNGTNTITITGSNLLSDAKINDQYPIIAKEVVNLTSNVFPGKIAGTYTFYDSKNAVICSGTFDYTAK